MSAPWFAYSYEKDVIARPQAVEIRTAIVILSVAKRSRRIRIPFGKKTDSSTSPPMAVSLRMTRKH